LYVTKQYDAEDSSLVRKALEVEALTESWKEYFREKLERLGA
jgi:hypothetical protein